MVKKKHKEVLRKTKQKVVKTITKRQPKFIKHVMRKQKLQNLTNTGKLKGKRN